MPRLCLVRSAAALLVALLVGCGGGAGTSQSGRIRVVTTISTFDSFVQAVGGRRVEVQSLVPVGASPETYQPTPQNVAALANAQILVENGAGLESWLGRTIQNASSKKLRIVVGTEGLPVKNNNPHLWMDPQYAKHYVRAIRDQLMLLDPIHADEYRRNAQRYSMKLDTMTSDIANRIKSLPSTRRVMIVQHNAWQYYNDRFGITTIGFLEVNPGQEPNPQQLAALVDLAKSRNVHAIFSEPEYSAKLAQQLAHDSHIGIVDNLYDDSIGTDPRVGDYMSMLNYDTDVIVKSLK